ncbi:dihydroxyacetone kinase subunit DhaL [Acetanaerobacterium elongatum]|uniref:phosphoenolpyruvate--glycerone phosphotransferase n=1 Tax=Acetanaerobacterium elongatum TaxID=258515 RepID=A0A1H0B2Y7_9FIRM|nr:dihydroxyacetone kinase subunit DhaL [Acetanaerobacterium elongatum]SDN39986.1 dihydroxyacetone kinase, C-terminal domain [Acetanaerobacterium elongatum]
MDKGYIIKLLENLKDIMMTNKDYLIQLDSVVGDGDLGLTMSDGFLAAYNAVKDTDDNDIGKILYAAGKAMSTAVPSTMGTLMASGFMNAGKVLKGTTEVTLTDIANLFDAYLEGVAARGKAKLGDKTFLDGLAPAVASLKASAKNQDTLEHAASDAAYAAEEGFMHTNQLLAVHGRAATRGEESRKLLDPGAAVAMLMMKAFHKSVR